MSILTFLAIIALIVFAGGVIFAVNVLFFEYSVHRNQEIAAEAYANLFGDDSADMDEAVETGNSHSLN